MGRDRAASGEAELKCRGEKRNEEREHIKLIFNMGKNS